MPKQLTTEDFIKKARKVHGDLYDYSTVHYTGAQEKVKIKDPIHGDFWQSPVGHYQGQGHPDRGRLKATNKRRMGLYEFVKRANKKYNNFYDYSKVEYINIDTKVTIIDPEYGEFEQSPYQHLHSHGCPERTKDNKWLIHEDHIIPMSIIHSRKRQHSQWTKERPLYKFLNSDINLIPIDAKLNRDKSDIVKIKGKKVAACSVRNNYKIIRYLALKLLDIDISNIITEDETYVNNYFDITG